MTSKFYLTKIKLHKKKIIYLAIIAILYNTLISFNSGYTLRSLDFIDEIYAGSKLFVKFYTYKIKIRELYNKKKFFFYSLWTISTVKPTP